MFCARLDLYELVKLSREKQPLVDSFNDVQLKALLSQPNLVVLLVFRQRLDNRRTCWRIWFGRVELKYNLVNWNNWSWLNGYSTTALVCVLNEALFGKIAAVANLGPHKHEDFSTIIWSKRWAPAFAITQLSVDSKADLEWTRSAYADATGITGCRCCFTCRWARATGFLLAQRAWIPSLLNSLQSQTKDLAAKNKVNQKQ